MGRGEGGGGVGGGGWGSNIFFVYFITVSVSFEENKIHKFILKCIESVGHHQCYINWSSAPYPSNIQTFKRIR